MRLFVGAAAWIGLALLLAGVAIGTIFAANVEQRIRDDLTATMTRLIAAIDPSDMAAALAEPLQDPRYQTPFGGLYWQVVDLADGTIFRSRSLWDHRLDLTGPDDGTPQYDVVAGPADQTLSALARTVRYRVGEGTRAYGVIVAEDRAALAASITRFGTDLAVALGILYVVLAGAAWLQVQLGLRPLRAIRDGIERIRSGGEGRLGGDYPSEVQPLVTEVNDLLRSQEASIAFARARASDLAHGLKTPLAVLASAAPALREKGDEETANLVDELSTAMADRIDYQLRLSRLRLRTRTERYSASLQEALDRIVAVLKRTRAGEELRWDLAVAPDLRVDVDAHDLIELVGVILENAAKWAKTKVAVRAAPSGAEIVLEVEDDGAGLPAGQLTHIADRGVRLDETKPGAGLGLAIAKEIVALNHGTIAFSASPLGGLLVRLTLPIATGVAAAPPA